jgi:hypothetical protein
MMKKNNINYAQILDLRVYQFIRDALDHIRNSTNHDNYFYINFATKKATISDELREQYPNTMTIVLQHQFSELEVKKDQFSIVLSFSGKPQKLIIPYNSIVDFVDPFAKVRLPIFSWSNQVNQPKEASQQQAAVKDEATDAENVVPLFK